MMIRPKMGFIVFGVHKDGLKDPLGVPFINQKIIDESKAAIEAKGRQRPCPSCPPSACADGCGETAVRRKL